MTQLNVLAVLLLGFQECDTHQDSDGSSLLCHLDVGSDVTRKSNQNKLDQVLLEVITKKDDAENLSCLSNLQGRTFSKLDYNLVSTGVVIKDASVSVKSYFLGQRFQPKLDSNMSNKALEGVFF